MLHDVCDGRLTRGGVMRRVTLCARESIGAVQSRDTFPWVDRDAESEALLGIHHEMTSIRLCLQAFSV